MLDRLWIGSTHDLDGATPLFDLGFRSVLDLRDSAPQTRYDRMNLMRLATRDGDRWRKDDVDAALAFVADGVRVGRVLVACGAGMSRSASIAIGYLVRCGFDPAAAFQAVKAARPLISPSSKTLASVLEAVADKRDVTSQGKARAGRKRPHEVLP